MRHRFLAALGAGRLLVAALGAAGLLVSVHSPAGAQDEDLIDRTPRDCISASRISYTRVIDEATILFYMLGGAVYRNLLPQACPGLDRPAAFVYAPRGGRLCNVDVVTVQDLGSGRPCALGAFARITREEARLLQRDPEALDAIDRSIEVEEVDPSPDAEDGTGVADAPR